MKGWNDYRVFHNLADVKTFDFINPSSDHIISTLGMHELTPTERIAFPSYRIGGADTEHLIAEEWFAVTWGNMEYKDIFGTFYTVRQCMYYVFTRDETGATAMHLPALLRPECNRRESHEPTGTH